MLTHRKGSDILKRLAVLGSTGMAGHMVACYLNEQGYDVYCASRSEKNTSHSRAVDVTDFPALSNWLDEIAPEVIVNCVGLLPRDCEARADLAVLINSYLPHFLERRSAATDCKVVHLSTDCVFSGTRGGCREDVLPDGRTMYDRSKALGELQNEKDLTLRMSIIGPDPDAQGTGLFNWFMMQSGGIQGWGGALWNGVTTFELARGIDAAVKNQLSGLYHFVPKEPIDKCSLLELIGEVFDKRNVKIHRVAEPEIDKTLMNTRTDFSFAIRDYRTQMEDMKAWVLDHRELYPHYFHR